mgnify:CR=1 FL=1
MVELRNVSYDIEEQEILNNINLTIKKGECILFAGESGSGKTTLTKIINGLIPHFYSSGKLIGSATVCGESVAEIEMYRLAETIGNVFQNPKSQFFYMDSTAEISFGLENKGVSPEEIRNIITKVKEELGIEHLLGRNIFRLSGGEKQMIAFASVYVTNPEIYVLDEPSSNLDNESMDRFGELIQRIKMQGKTVILAEHRLSYVKSVIDRMIYLQDGRIAHEFTRNQIDSLSDRERMSMGLRSLRKCEIGIPRFISKDGELCIRELCSYYTEQKISFGASSGDVIGIIGKNGMGKTTLCKMICGLIKEQSGTVIYHEKKLSAKKRQRLCAMVMQDVNHQLFADSVYEECELVAPDAKENEIKHILSRFDLLPFMEAHPAILSGGQRQRLAVCQAILSEKRILIFDEPTSGLDYRHMIQTSVMIRELSKKGMIVLVITHDYEFMNLTCHGYIMLEKMMNQEE